VQAFFQLSWPGLSRPSRLGGHRASPSGMRGSSPRMTAGVKRECRTSFPDPIVKQPSSILLAADFSARAPFVFSIGPLKSEGAERHWRQHLPCSVEHGAGLRRDRLRQRRSTAASSRLSPRPWGPSSLWSRSRGFRRSGGCKAILGVYLTPGGLIQGRPGSWLRTTTAGAAPPSRRFRLQTSLRRRGMFAVYINSKTMSIDYFYWR
jgi:hypothetical protein